MRIIRDSFAAPEASRGAVIALGNFDGVHRGHQQVLARAREVAEVEGRPCAVMTFEPHPRRLFRPDLPSFAITPFRSKVQILASLGIDYLFAIRFNRTFSQMSASGFVADLLIGQLGVRHVVTGPNFIFGHNRGGNSEMLHRMAKDLSFGYSEVPPFEMDGIICSSTKIREAVQAGDIAMANRLLGRNYAVSGHVQHGQKLGRELGYPTANLPLRNQCYPADGIYVVKLALEGGAPMDAVASLGTRPTFDGKGRILEVHCLDASPDLYGKRVEVEFLARLRDELRYESAEALKDQIAKDIVQARAILC